MMYEEERRILELCKVLIDQPINGELLLLEIGIMKRYCGEWYKEKIIMFPRHLCGNGFFGAVDTAI